MPDYEGNVTVVDTGKEEAEVEKKEVEEEKATDGQAE